VKNLEKVQNRRKAVIFVSNGYDMNPFEGARYADPNLVGMKNSQRTADEGYGRRVRPFQPAEQRVRGRGFDTRSFPS
jgi:hypothetical protein